MLYFMFMLLMIIVFCFILFNVFLDATHIFFRKRQNCQKSNTYFCQVKCITCFEMKLTYRKSSNYMEIECLRIELIYQNFKTNFLLLFIEFLQDQSFRITVKIAQLNLLFDHSSKPISDIQITPKLLNYSIRMRYK